MEYSMMKEEVTPFSNGTEAMMWKENNCDQCKKYECLSKTPQTAKCRLAWFLDFGEISGVIPRDVAEQIGIEKDGGNYVQLKSDCNMFSDEDEGSKPRKPYVKPDAPNQLRMFVLEEIIEPKEVPVTA